MREPILVTLLKMRPHYSQSSRENVTTYSGTSPLASYKEKEVPPTPTPPLLGGGETLGNWKPGVSHIAMGVCRCYRLVF